MGTTLPLQIKSATWTVTSTSSSGTKVTNSITLDNNSKYLMVLIVPVMTITGGYKAALFNLYGFTNYIRLIDATRGVGLWYITTSSSSVTTYARTYFSQSTSYSETNNAMLYAIKLGPADGAPYITSKQGVLLPLDVETASWTASSSAAYNTKVTGDITFQGGHKYIVFCNPANWGSDTTILPFGLSGNISNSYLNIRSRESAIWLVDRTGVSTNWTSGISTAFSGSYSYSNTAYAGVYSIKIA